MPGKHPRVHILGLEGLLVRGRSAHGRGSGTWQARGTCVLSDRVGMSESLESKLVHQQSACLWQRGLLTYPSMMAGEGSQSQIPPTTWRARFSHLLVPGVYGVLEMGFMGTLTAQTSLRTAQLDL